MTDITTAIWFGLWGFFAFTWGYYAGYRKAMDFATREATKAFQELGDELRVFYGSPQSKSTPSSSEASSKSSDHTGD
jgi:hypothetical protein